MDSKPDIVHADYIVTGLLALMNFRECFLNLLKSIVVSFRVEHSSIKYSGSGFSPLALT